MIRFILKIGVRPLNHPNGIVYDVCRLRRDNMHLC